MARTLLALSAAKGLPSVITMRTAAGICRATSRAMMPPRPPADEADLQAGVLPELLDPTGHGRKVGVRSTHVATTAPTMDLIAKAFEKTTDSVVDRSSAPSPGRSGEPGLPPGKPEAISAAALGPVSNSGAEALTAPRD
jgi:hypothetical protein